MAKRVFAKNSDHCVASPPFVRSTFRKIQWLTVFVQRLLLNAICASLPPDLRPTV
ncbi:hypothetical protein KIN20_037344 [Parelaphostrongylus tenuis]|uniref:Uncharacterized protein n=1 Tax=Parelaphostrongylus tenuis TaxID=148309 RepID=A0AAD5WMD8_PARTN|nr:hypothetical protein KIN20_037344 [Parelaphostrongylus tenuis]